MIPNNFFTAYFAILSPLKKRKNAAKLHSPTILLVITGFAASPVAAFALGLPYLRKKPVRAMQVCFKLPYLIFQFCTFQL